MAKKILFIIAVLTGCSKGSEWQNYRIEAFHQAKDRGLNFYIHYWEAGNPVCEKQKEILGALIKEEKFKDTKAYRAKLDDDPFAEAELKIKSPCHIIAFKKGKEWGRLSNTTDANAIYKLLISVLHP